jgi:hypothetical protein
MAFENEPAISLEFPELRSINDHFEVRGNITRYVPTHPPIPFPLSLLLVSLSVASACHST